MKTYFEKSPKQFPASFVLLKETLLLWDSGTYIPKVVLFSQYPATLASEGGHGNEESNQAKSSAALNQWSDTTNGFHL